MSKEIRSELAFDLSVQEDIRLKKRLPMDHIVDLSFSIVDVEDSLKVFGRMGFRMVPLLDDDCDAFTMVNDASESLLEAMEVVARKKPQWFSGERSEEPIPPYLVYIDFVAVEDGFKRTILGEAAATMALKYISNRFFDGQDMFAMPVVWDTDQTFSKEEGYLPPPFDKFSDIKKGSVIERVGEDTFYSFVPNFSPKVIADYSDNDIKKTRALSEIKEDLSEKKRAAEDWAKKMKNALSEARPKQKSGLAL